MYVYTETKNCSSGTVQFTPVTSKGIPLFSSITFASASGISGTTSALGAVLCGIAGIATDGTSVTFNCVANAGVLLGGNTFGLANGTAIRCFIIGKENPAAASSIGIQELDGIFYKI